MGLGLFAVLAENWIIKGIRHCCCLLGLTTSSMVNLMDGKSQVGPLHWDVERDGIGIVSHACMLIERPTPGVELGRV